MARKTKAEQRRDVTMAAHTAFEGPTDNLEDLTSEIDEVRMAMEDNFQGTNRYEMVETAASELEEIVTEMRDILERLDGGIDFAW